MNIGPASTKSLRVKVGGPLKILLVAQPAALLERMAEVVRSIEGVQLAGSFSNPTQAVDALVWKPGGWQVAFVDLGLPESASDEVIQRLVSEERAGTVVALADHLWREVREKCAALGVHHVLEKGDLVALRSFIEERAH